MIFNKNNKKGFTLVEVMVTMVVSGILFAMIAAVAASLVNNYKHSTKIRELNYEVETIENYVTITLESLNLRGATLVVNTTSNGFTLTDTTEEPNTLTYEKDINTISLSLSDSILELEYIANIEVRAQNKTGLVLTITTVDNTEFVSYYKVLNM